MKPFTTTFQAALGATALVALGSIAQADIVHLDDVIIDGSLCVGQDCVNGESFGFDTIRLKENNLRIGFTDTSNSASFPQNDWEIEINDSANGGGNYFRIDDVSGGRSPFTIEASAPSHSLYVDDGGRMGFGTSTPVVELHVVNGDSPTLRLEQNGSSGFTPQTFDIAANETNFFVRDVTNGSQLPFRIQPGADTNALYIANNNEIGMGTNTPDADLHVIGTGGLLVDQTDGGAGDAPLHVRRSDGTAAVKVEETMAGAGNLTMMLLDNAGGRPRLQLTGAGNAAQTGNWTLSAGNTVVLQDLTNGDDELILDSSGNMTILGMLSENSDKHSKMAIVPIDAHDILDKVTALPVSTWTYKNDEELGTRHIGPMAQDFFEIFGTGANETKISSIDTSGVALAAIQALATENAELKSRLDALEAQLAD